MGQIADSKGDSPKPRQPDADGRGRRGSRLRPRVVSSAVEDDVFVYARQRTPGRYRYHKGTILKEDRKQWATGWLLTWQSMAPKRMTAHRGCPCLERPFHRVLRVRTDPQQKALALMRGRLRADHRSMI